jgi:hypothetical protein
LNIFTHFRLPCYIDFASQPLAPLVSFAILTVKKKREIIVFLLSAALLRVWRAALAFAPPSNERRWFSGTMCVRVEAFFAEILAREQIALGVL